MTQLCSPVSSLVVCRMYKGTKPARFQKLKDGQKMRCMRNATSGTGLAEVAEGLVRKKRRGNLEPLLSVRTGAEEGAALILRPGCRFLLRVSPRPMLRSAKQYFLHLNITNSVISANI